MATAAAVVVTEAALLSVELPAGAAGAENPRIRSSAPAAVSSPRVTVAMHAMAAMKRMEVYRGMVNDDGR